MAWPAGAPPPRVTTDLRSCRQTTLHFHCAFEIRQSQSLAHMLDSLVRVSRRAARDDAKAEPILANRFALAVAQSFAKRSHCTQDQAGRSRQRRTVCGAPVPSEDGAGPTRLEGSRPAIRPNNEAPTCQCQTKGGAPPTGRQQHAPAPFPIPTRTVRQPTSAYLSDDTRHTCALSHTGSFTGYLTLSSEYFSTFHHCTC